MRYEDRADRDRLALYDGSGDTRSRRVKQLPARPRLESRLDSALAHRLTVLVADAGFGKTTLLGSWSAGIRAVVYPVATGDQDLTRLWRHLVGALQQALPDLAEGVWAGEVRGPVSARSETVRPQAMAELLGQALAQRLTEDLVLVLDDAHLVAGGPAASFVAGLVRHAPPLLHVVLASRGPLPVAAARLRTQGQVLELAGAELAFTTGEVATLLAEVVGVDARGLAEELRAGTGGWPIAVRLAVEALRELPPGQRPGRLARLATPHGQLADLIGAIYAQEAAPVRRLLATGALFGRFPVGLFEALGVPDAAALITGLTRRGLFLEPAPESQPSIAGAVAGAVAGAAAGSRPAGEPAMQWYRLHPLARRFLTEQQPLPAEEVAKLREAAVYWLADHGLAHTALRWLVPRHPDDLLGRDPDDGRRRHGAVATLLADAGERLATSGHAAVVVDAVESLPAEFRDPRIEQLAGHAYLVRGDWDEALARYARAAGDRDRLPAGLAWRIGMVHYLRGEHDQALAVYERAEVPAVSTGDTALLLAWTAAAHWIRGDAKACGELATRALEIASDAEDATALAAAHTVLSMLAALKGDRRANAARYRRALEYATEAGDVLQLIRIHSNRASHSLEEGDYGPALAELEVAIGLADMHGYGAFGGLALTNRAEIRLRLGHLEEAHHDIETALAVFEDLGSRKAAYPLGLLGRLHQLRGDDAAAVRAYERALAHVAASGDRQAQVAVLAGLARVLAATDPDRAASLAEQALAAGDGMGYVDALVASARVAAARPAAGMAHGAIGPAAVARQRARAARDAAQARRDRAGIAEADEIEAGVAETESEARELAGRAVALWGAIGDQPGQARAELVLAEHLDPAAARVAVEAVRQRMGTIGCRSLTARADAMLARIDARLARTDATPARADAPSARGREAVVDVAGAVRPVRVETFGGFRVVRDGTVLPGPAWSSRKARDALKILVARRGRPVTREFLMEALWPGQPPPALANRLHVALSALRTTLDPERHHPGDAFVVTDDESIRLRLEDVQVDVEEFLDDAAAGLALLRAGRVAEALPRLTRAESRYAGDFLEEDLYEDWAVPVREQARTTYLSVAGRLAHQAEAGGDVDAAARYLLRLLEHDPYDERAHLRLVSSLAAAGRHGDARRHYRHYCARMDELDVEAAPFPTSGLSGS